MLSDATGLIYYFCKESKIHQISVFVVTIELVCYLDAFKDRIIEFWKARMEVHHDVQ